ncbi:MAG: hypothetical protein ACE149_11825 [Armatimonadota bacterium]
MDSRDRRLPNARLSISDEETTLEGMLDELSRQTGVQLVAEDTLAGIRLTAFLFDQPLDSVMVALADLFSGYWAFPRGAPPETRSYCLTTYERPASLDEVEDRLVQDYKRARAAPLRAERDARVALYRSALGLPPGELLERYEISDPWLCADLLDPALRPIIEYVCGLDEPVYQELLGTGEAALPLRVLDAALRGHLGQWSGGEWGEPAGALARPEPDRLATFASPEERWANARVRLWWGREGLHLLLEVPDVGQFDAWAIRMESRPRRAREKLARLGYREGTPAYRAAAEAEAERWQEEHEAPSGATDPQAAGTGGPSPPGETYPLLSLAIPLEGGNGWAWSAADMLSRFARERQLQVIAHYHPPEIARIRRSRFSGSEVSLGDVLHDMRGQVGFYLSWELRGDVLVVANAGYQFFDQCILPESLLATWRGMLSPGSLTTIAELSDHVAAASGPQLEQLVAAFPLLRQLGFDVHTLRVYGMLSPAQKDDASRPPGLRFSVLSAEQQRVITRYARSTRPWVEPADFTGAVIRVLPRRLSTGEEGISLVIDYGFAQSPSDRDAVFTAPVVIHLPPAGSRGD